MPNDEFDCTMRLSSQTPFRIFGCIIFGRGIRGHNAADYEGAARMVLSFYRSEPDAAVAYMAAFMTCLHAELDLDDSYLGRLHPESATIGGGLSIARLALMRFQELLFHNPTMIRQIMDHPNCSSDVRNNSWLANCQRSDVALTRGIDWHPSEQFTNPEPIPRIIVQSFMLQRRQDEEASRHSRDLERRQSKLDKLDHRLQNAAKNAKRRDVSSKTQRSRLEALERPIVERLRQYLSNPITPITGWPIDASELTSEVLRELTISELGDLNSHIMLLRRRDWKELYGRVKEILPSE